MPRYYKSTAMNPGAGIRKGYRHGGRNLRDEEARVIGVQDNAADELRRVRARRPHDAAERRDRRAQLGRVGSRERNARDEMRRLRGEARRFQYGGGIGRQMGGIDSLPRPLTGLTRPTIMRMPSGVQGQPWPGGEPPPNQSGVAYPRPRMGALPDPLGSPRVPPMQPPRGMNDYQRMGLEPFQGGRMASNPVGQRPMPGQGFIPPGPRQAMDFSGSPLLQQQLQKRLAAQQATGPTGPTFAMPRPGEPPRTLQPLPDPVQTERRRLGLPDPPPVDQQRLARMRAAQQNPAMTPFGFAQQEQRLGNPNYDLTGRVNPATGQIARPRGDFNPPPLTRSVSPRAGRGIAPVQRGSSPKPWFPSTQRPEYLPETQAQFVPWARGGRVGLKKGGRIPRKKGAKFI